MQRKRRLDHTDLAQFCKKHHIRRMALSGITLNGTAGPASDVDLLVDFASDGIPSLFGVVAMEQALSQMLGGRTVDLRTLQDLSLRFREQLVQSAQVLHAS